ncbi:MAG TPA: hypothetical protein VKQ08_00465 [Cyclobacteriaceae bacterium]|nr:hypothetical protein [Cyclobacteriaceae bacterium]
MAIFIRSLSTPSTKWLKSSARKKNPLVVSRFQSIRRKGFSVLAASKLFAAPIYPPMSGRFSPHARLSRRVDFPVPLSPTKIVTCGFSATCRANRIAGILKGKGCCVSVLMEKLRRNAMCSGGPYLPPVF